MNHLTTEYPVLSLTREDLEAVGFDSRELDDAVLTRLAGKMADEFMDDFLNILGRLAEQFDVPQRIPSEASQTASSQAQ